MYFKFVMYKAIHLEMATACKSSYRKHYLWNQTVIRKL